MAARLNFGLTAGDTLKIRVTHVDEETGLPRSLIAAEILWAFGKLEGGAFPDSAIATKSIDSGIVVVDALTGRYDIDIDPADTADLSGEYYHEAQITDVAGVNTVLKGRMKVERGLIP